MIKALVVGCGKIGGTWARFDRETHASAYHCDPYTELSGCVDVDSEMSALFQTIHGGRSFESLEEAVRLVRPGIVSVCTPDRTHYDITARLTELLHPPAVILLEKPATRTLDEIDSLISLSRKRNIKIVVNHTRRFDPRFKGLRDEITKGTFGDLVSASVCYYSGWFHNGVHAVDTLHLLFGDVLQIMTVQQGAKSRYPDDPSLDCTAAFESCGAAVNFWSFDESHYQLMEFDLRFTGGRLKIEDFGERVSYEQRTKNSSDENVLVPKAKRWPSNTVNPLEEAVRLSREYLQTQNPSLLQDVEIEQTRSTMQTIIQGTEMYEDCRFA